MTPRSSAALFIYALTLNVLVGQSQSPPRQPTPPEPPSAVVTFYSSSGAAHALKGMLPGYKYGPFSGGIFDGKHLLSQIIPSYFVTFTLPPGPHIFSASVDGYAPSKLSHFEVNLVADRQYFFRIDQQMIIPPVGMPGTYRGIIEQTPCADAAKDNAKAKPLKPKHILPDALQLAVADTSFPTCP